MTARKLLLALAAVFFRLGLGAAANVNR